LEDLRDIEMDIEVKEIRREERRTVLQFATKKEREKYDRLIVELETLKTKQPGLERKVDEIRRKLEFLKFRRELKYKREGQLKEITADFSAADKELRKREKENERLQNAVLKLREIHRYKTSPEVLKKLFYNMPLSHSKRRGGKKKGGIGKILLITRIDIKLCIKKIPFISLQLNSYNVYCNSIQFPTNIYFFY
jgi:dynactin complex subunit